MCLFKITGLCGNTINVCEMRYMSGNEMSAHEEAEKVFRAVKMLFENMNELEYESVKRMVVHLRECMDLLYRKVSSKYVKGETWAAKMDWWTEAKYYMQFVTGRLNECYADYEAENSCDLSFDMYEGFVDVLDQCRRWMNQLIEEEPEWGEDGMELEPVPRVTEEEYETALVHLSEQIGAQLVGWCPEGEAYKLASDRLANTCQVGADQTVLDWIRAACAAVGASAAVCTGL